MMTLGYSNKQQSITSNSDVELWEQAYHANLPKIYNYFLCQVQDQAVAKDLTAELFETAWTQRHTYDSEKASYATWLFAIARRKRADYYRKQKWTWVKLSNRLIDQSDSPDQQVEMSFKKRKLYDLIQTLSPRDQEILSLRYGAGMTNRQIATTMEMSESTIGTVVSRTLKHLRVAWGDDNE